MNLTRDRLHTIGHVGALGLALLITAALMLRVNAVKSQVRLAERQIVALKRDKLLLETEFETRANQRQLAELNMVEFGYRAPNAGQYLEGERQLALLGKARDPGAPAPIRVAHADRGEDQAGLLTAMVSPLTGQFVASAQAATAPARKGAPLSAGTLRQRLGEVRPAPGHAPRVVRE